MARRLPKFPLKMANGENVRSIEDLRENADIDSIVTYFLSGQLSLWCRAFGYDNLPEQFESVTYELIKSIYKVLEIPVNKQEIETYVKKNHGFSVENIAVTDDIEEESPDNLSDTDDTPEPENTSESMEAFTTVEDGIFTINYMDSKKSLEPCITKKINISCPSGTVRSFNIRSNDLSLGPIDTESFMIFSECGDGKLLIKEVKKTALNVVEELIKFMHTKPRFLVTEQDDYNSMFSFRRLIQIIEDNVQRYNNNNINDLIDSYDKRCEYERCVV